MEINHIYNEDCLETLARMPEGFLDLTVTSPPYDDLRVYKGYSFDVEATARGLYRATKDGGVVVWVVNDRTVDGDETGTSFKHALTFKAAGFKLWDTMIFEKENGLPGDFGPRYRPGFEYMFAFSKGTPKTFNPIMEPCRNPGTAFSKVRLEREGRNYFGGRTGEMVVADTRIAKNIFKYPVGFILKGGRSQLESFKHPAVFPLQLAKDQITTWSNPGDLIYDPFMGSGTTAVASALLERNYIGSEVSEEYAEGARERIRRETAMPLFDEQTTGVMAGTR
jgi:DNA modification methylase